jgi:hypothetical protein
MSETQDFMCRLVSGCNERGYDPAAFLAVRLFETGSTLSAYYQTDIAGLKYQSQGLLQWTVTGVEIFNSDKSRANSERTFLVVKDSNRLKQLEYAFKYFDIWANIGAKVDFNEQYLWHYVKTLAPGRGPDTIQKNNPTPREIVEGSGAVGKNFRGLKVLAQKMLNGTADIPRDSPTVEYFNQRGTRGLLSARVHHQKYGFERFNPSACSAKYTPKTATKPAEKPKPSVIEKPKPGVIEKTSSATNEVVKQVNEIKSTVKPTSKKAKVAFEERFPLKMTFTIPEYPRLVFMKPGDVIILPPPIEYRDWLVSEVNREFYSGINKLTVSAMRPLEVAPFTSLGGNFSPTMGYYYLQ